MLATNNAKLAEAQQAQTDMLRKQRELEDAKREVELTVEKKVQENLATVRDKARLEAEDALKSKVTEKETQIAGMARQIEELRRRADQGSQQLQGEALEIELESLLRSRFPRDLIEPVAKGGVRRRCDPPRAWPRRSNLRHHSVGVQAHAELE
jgi:hypothetical protein